MYNNYTTHKSCFLTQTVLGLQKVQCSEPTCVLKSSSIANLQTVIHNDSKHDNITILNND